MKEPGHVVVLYRGLSTHPEKTLRSLCRVLGLEFKKSLLDRQQDRDFVTESEKWKRHPDGPIRPAPSKFPHIFDETTRRKVEDDLDMGFFHSIEDRIEKEPGSLLVSGQENV